MILLYTCNTSISITRTSQKKPARIDDPKRYLNYVQLGTKLHYIAPLITISKLSGSVNCGRGSAALPTGWRCPQSRRLLQQKPLSSGRRAGGPGGGSAQRAGPGPGQRPGTAVQAGAAVQAGPGSSQAASVGQGLWLAGGQRREGGGCSPQTGIGRGISTRHLLYHSRTRLSSTHYLLIVYLCF